MADRRKANKGERGGRGSGFGDHGAQGSRAGEDKRTRSAGPARAPRTGRSGARETHAGERAALYIEGRRAAAEALRCGFPVKRALVAEGEGDAGTREYLQVLQAAGVPVEFVSRARLDEISSHGAHQGIALEVGAFPYKTIEDVISASGAGPALVVVLDHVTDEGNLGAIVRSAEVVGASGVVVANKRAAGVGVGTFKTSAGAVMHLPIAQVTNLARAIDQLKEAGFWVVGASEHAEDIVWNAPLDGRIALVMGSEGSGISRLLLEKCDVLAKLPQRGQTESLNVAQAATVFCYEWLRRNQGVL